MPRRKRQLCIGDLPNEVSRRFPTRQALVFQGQRCGFRVFKREVDEAAKGFIILGVEPGDHVALWLNNCAEYLFIMFALAKIGAVVVPINARFRTEDLAYVLRQSDSFMLITHDVSGPVNYLRMVREVVDMPTAPAGAKVDPDSVHWVTDDRFPRLRRVITLDFAMRRYRYEPREYLGTISWLGVLSDTRGVPMSEINARARAVKPDDTALIMYTSGTTGFPKGVMHSHRLLENIAARAERMAITENDAILNYLPLFHAFGFSEAALMCMLTGAAHILTETFDADEALDLVEREGVTIAHGFDTHLKALCDAQEAKPRDLGTLRTGIFAAGMHSSTPGARRGERVLSPLEALSAYGMTEVWVGAALSAPGDDAAHRLESSGHPAPGYEFKVVDPDTGALLPRGEPGELRVRGRFLMQGYYKKPDETAAAYDEDGWFRTGDMAEHHADGYVRFLGRFKDMLKVGGENVDPMEVEGLVAAHPAVDEVAVVGLPDPRLAQVPVAFVVRKQGARLAEQDILAHCRGKVASFKAPRHVVFVDALPVTATGKVRKVELREEAERLLLPGDGNPGA